MRPRRSMWLLLSWIAAVSGAALDADAADAVADAPSELSVTIYRAPNRPAGSIDLDQLNGFALISETRSVHLPAGESRLRFEGVADGIEPASAIVTGLPAGVVEKNRAGALLSPSALVAAAVGKPVVLQRVNPKTGKLERRSGRILADAEGGVVLETVDGIEGLRCSGLAEGFSFEAATDLAAHPTLSVLVRGSQPMNRTVKLTYLARGFDWAADYTAILSADATRMDLGAWVTLANGNGIGFPAAHAQVIAGRVNRERGEIEPIDAGGAILASCWPRGSTSDIPALLQLDRASALGGELRQKAALAPMPLAAPGALTVTAQRVEQEQLGDLKLYRVPDRTTVASRQSKQVRLLDRTAIPVASVYSVDLAVGEAAAPASASASAPVSRLLRTRNDTAHHLGLPLPSGRIAVFMKHRGDPLLEHESGMRDLAIGEEVEIDMGLSPDVLAKAVRERADTERVEISNALAAPIDFELRLQLPEGVRIVQANHAFGTKNGRPICRVAIPAHATVTLRYQTQHTAKHLPKGRGNAEISAPDGAGSRPPPAAAIASADAAGNRW